MNKASILIVAFACIGTNAAAWATCDQSVPETTPARRFDIRNDTVYAKRTDLTWARCGVGQKWDASYGGCAGSLQKMTWDQAQQYTASLGGGWRLPTREELLSIREGRCQNPTINEVIFPNTEPTMYWTSTPDRSSASAAGYVDFADGDTFNNDRALPLAVRLVHGGQ